MADPYTGDRIILKDLGFYGYHGLFSEEKTLGQRFFIDLELGVDLAEAAETDRLSAGISYADIYDTVKTSFEAQPMRLLEAVAQNVSVALFDTFAKVNWIIIRIRKPEAPIAMVRGEVAIELQRVRKAS